MPGPRIEQHVLKDRLISPVDVLLCALANVDKAEARGRALAAHEPVEHKRVKAVIVPAALGILRVVLCGKERFILSGYEFAVMQDGLAVLPALLVVPVHHGALAVVVNRVVVDVARHVDCRVGKAVFQLRVVVLKDIVVLKGDIEHVPALLNIRDA